MDKDWDNLLKTGLVAAPGDFTDRVMREIGRLPIPEPPIGWIARMQWCALLGGAAFGTRQLITFIFGMWFTTAAF